MYKLYLCHADGEEYLYHEQFDTPKEAIDKAHELKEFYEGCEDELIYYCLYEV